jgi:fructose-6-phosphate aldolase 2
MEEAEYLQSVIGGNLYIKVPVIPEGIKAIKNLKKQGFKVTATAIFTAQQALMAGVAGADFVAPYVNRIDNISGNGTEVVGIIIDHIATYNLKTKVLAASFKNAQQVHEVAKLGAQAVTVNGETINQMLAHPLTDWSVNQFIADWESIYGKNKITMDVE